MNQIEARIRDGQPFRRFAPNATEPVIDAQTGLATFIFNTEEVGRDGHVVYNRGIHTENYDRNPTILFAHDDGQPPVGRALAIRIGEPASKVDIQFTPRDLNPFGAMIGDLVRGKYLNTCSMSWMPIKWKFSTDKNRAGGVDFLEVDLLEISIVPIPALPGAVATARANGIDTRPLYQWAEKLLDTSGQIIVPRTELEQLRRAARMPAASKATQDPAAAAVESVLVAKHKRALTRAPKVPVFKRGLYGVAQLCELLNSLGYCHDSAEYEASLEEDESPVPGMLGEALVTLGEALKAMAVEEVDELLEAHGDDDEEADIEARALSAAQRAHIAAGETPRARAWRAGIAVARAGKALSKSNQEKLGDAQGHHARALAHSKTLGEHHDAVGEHMQAAADHHERTTDTLAQIGEHLRAIQDPTEASDADSHIDEAVKYHRAATGHLEKLGTSQDDMADRHADVGDSHRALGRSVKSAQRCVRSVLQHGVVSSEADESEADKLENDEAAQTERARKAREARAARARELAKQYREPIILD